jgi:cytochrome bd-type quinol oxidase subunit 1
MVPLVYGRCSGHQRFGIGHIGSSCQCLDEQPTGFDPVDGKYTNIDPIKAMFNPAWFSQALHMSVAAFAATGFAVAGVHALMIMRKQNVNFHLCGF